VQELFATHLLPVTERRGTVEVTRRDPFVRVTGRIAGAASLGATELSSRVAKQYAAISGVLSSLDRYPIRFWNYVPGIVDALDRGVDRYMAFNRGRHLAYTDLHGSPNGFARSIPTASAVGITGPDLVIDCLASDEPGTPVENPRQTASWQYSRRYGPRPPCFARGTLTTIDGRRVLLLGGTASIVGEESRHLANRAAQVEEVLTNMEALIANAAAERPADSSTFSQNGLARLTDARIYVVDADDAESVEKEIQSRVGRSVRFETVVARVCRPELLVEIEGVASMADDSPRAAAAAL